MNRQTEIFMIIILIGLVLFACVPGRAAGKHAELEVQSQGPIPSPLYLLTYDHGGCFKKVSLEHTMNKMSLAEVDLAGTELRSISDTFNLEPWKIKTIRLRPAKN